MNNFFKKHAYLWFALILTLCALRITQSQKVEEPTGVQNPIDHSITQETLAEQPYTLDEADISIVEKVRSAATDTGAPAVPITLPNLGTIPVAISASEQPAIGIFANINLSPLPVLLTNGTVTLTPNNTLTITGQATVFNQPAQFTLVQLSKEPGETTDANQTTEQANGLTFTRVRLRFHFNQKPTITLFPGKAFELNTLDLVLENNKPPTLITDISILNQKATLTFGTAKDRLIVSFSLNNIRLASLVPPLSTTPFAGITLKQVNFSTNQVMPSALVTPETDTITTLTGMADFSSLTLPFDKTKVNNLTIQATISNLKGIKLTAALTDIELPVLGRIEEAGFRLTAPGHDVLAVNQEDLLDLSRTAATHQELGVVLTLEGKGELSIPNQEPIPYTLEAEYGDTGFIIKGSITRDVTFSNATLKQASFRLNPTTRELAITGDSTIGGFAITLTVYVRQHETTGAKTVVIEGVAKNATLQPFAQSGIAGLSTLTFSNVKVGVGATAGPVTAGPELTLGGTVKLFDQELAATIQFVTGEQAAPGVVFTAELPDNWQFPGIPVKFAKAHVVGTTVDHTDPITQQIYTKGLSLAVQFELPDTIATLVHKCQTTADQKLTCADKTVTLIASFDPTDLSKTRFGTKLSDTIVSTEKVAIGPVFFYIAVGTPLSMILDMTLTIKPSPKDKNIVFKSLAEVDPEKLVFAASLRPDDFWQNPFGIQGFAIGGLGVKLGINFIQFAATGLPSEIGLAGTLKISDKLLSLSSLFDTHFIEMALRGQLQGELSLADLVNLFAQPVGVQIPLDKVPRVALKDILVKFAPKTVSIGQIVIEQGLTLHGALDIFNVSALLDFNVDITGIRARGYTNAINIKDVLLIAGDSPQGGPIFDLQLNPAQQYVHMNGSLELRDITKVTTMLDITSNGIGFNFSSKFGDAVYQGKPLLYAQVSGAASTLVNPQFALTILFEQTLNRFILEQLNQSIAQSKQQVEQAFTSAQQQLTTLNTLSQQLQQKSDSIKSSITQAQQLLQVINTHITTVNQVIAERQKEVQVLQQAVTQLQAQIEAEKTRFNNLSLADRFTQSLTTGAKLTQWGTELAAKQIAYSTAKGVLELAQKAATTTLQTAQQLAQRALTAGQQVFTALTTGIAQSGLDAIKSSASSILDIVNKGTLGTLSAGQQAGTFVLSAFDVRKVYFNSNLDNIKAGVLANVQADLMLLNKPATLNFNLDVHNVNTSIAPIIKQAQDSFNQTLINSNFAAKLTQLKNAPQAISQATQALQIQLPATVSSDLTSASQSIQQAVTDITKLQATLAK